MRLTHAAGWSDRDGRLATRRVDDLAGAIVGPFKGAEGRHEITHAALECVRLLGCRRIRECLESPIQLDAVVEHCLQRPIQVGVSGRPRIDAGGFCQVSGRLARREAPPPPGDMTKPGRTAGQHGRSSSRSCRRAAADCMRVRVRTYRNWPNASRQVTAALPACVQRSATYLMKRTLPLQVSGPLPTYSAEPAKRRLKAAWRRPGSADAVRRLRPGGRNSSGCGCRT